MKIYKYTRIYILLLLFIASGVNAFAQEVSGSIKSSKNKVLTGYLIKNPKNGDEAISGKLGEFIINASTDDLLEVYFEGQKVNELLVKGEGAVYSLHDNPFVKTVDGAYGKVNRLASSSAMDVLTADKIEATSFTNTEHATIGQLAGLTTLMSGGEPGSNGLSMYVRGLSSFRDAAPLILVDGFPSNFSHLNNYEIESITVLKDAVATAMYGLRAANGVILVTTKRGYDGKTSIKVNADFGTLMPTTLPEYVDAYNYSNMVNEAHDNDGLAPRYSNDELEGYRLDNDPYNYPNVDWQEEMLKSATDYMNTSLEFRGGSDRVKYYSLIGYMHADGLFKHTEENQQYSTANNFNRINFRTNADIYLTSKFDLNLGIGGRLENRNDPEVGTASLFSNIMSSPANRYVLYNENGSYGGSNQYRANPMAQIAGKGYTDSHTRFVNFNLRLNYDLDVIADGLTASVEGSYINAFTGNERFTASYEVYDRQLTQQEDGSLGVSYIPFGQEKTITSLARTVSQYRTETYRAYLNYDRAFGDHAINAMLLYDYSSYVQQNNAEPFNFQGLSLRANYGYKSTYFIDIVGAYNGNNSYNPDNQYGFFPAIGASWVMSNEAFLSDMEWLSYLKMRSSYGITGSSLLDGYGRFSHVSDYSSDGSYRFARTGGNVTGLSESTGVNDKLEWSKNHQFNIGFDAVLFQKVNLSFDYFNQTNTDILQSINPVVTDMVGFAVPQVNYGEVKNAGFESSLSYAETLATGWSWYVEGNIGFAQNEITKFYQLENDPTPMVGQSITAIYGYIADGFYQDASDIASSPVNTLDRVQAGDVKYLNITPGDNMIDEYDRTVIGNSFPQMHYGMNLGLEYKGIYISASLDGSQRDLMMNGHDIYRPLGSGYGNVSEYAAANYWTPERSNSASLPRLTVQDNYNNYVASTMYMQNGNYLRLRTAELGYKFNSSVLSRIKMSSAKLYIRGHNLAVLHNIDGDIDPEVRSGHPLLKSFNIGLNVQF
ncbi:SusC/RagA family TonB-linked outer membrane protein [Carboxylicivirga sp. M1479]|uniref:SusC/RagA family TonB-linked outer membrane protein n=1 Tax=Carboxylicivirga sp. M1479 TaxID=2594476 RepID=UPI00117897DF|nr:SusC/RagA family TonB-linked outer membrane protein [Carboxylicivirga sp. M1479]TRX66282.1 SusC/RagA family TonB-linked outer membrane protein [Carboxylicivirga sp. M1479]